MSVGLNTARALVIDDNYDEARAVLLALSRLRIGSVYLNGDIELIDSGSPFQGIRLAFVDMDLQGSGLLSVEECGVQAADFVSSVVSPGNGVLGVLIWSKHPDAEEAFLSRLRERLPSSAVLHISTMEKPDPTSQNTGEVADNIAKVVVETLEKATGIRLLWEWEQLMHHAVSRTTDSIIEVIGREPGIDLSSTSCVSVEAVKALGLLSAAARERKAKSGREAVSHAFLALLPVLEDGAERGSEDYAPAEEEKLDKLLKISKDPKTLRELSHAKRVRYGRLNRMVHASRFTEEDVPLLPGNVYELDSKLANDVAIDESGLCKLTVGDSYKEDEGSVETKLIVAEVSAACDYSQDKVDMPRLLGGAIVPVERLKKVRSDDFLYKSFGVFNFDEGEVGGIDKGVYHLVLNARFLTGVTCDKLSGRTPLFRIRRNTLIDIQAWLAWRGNRPGVITIAF